MRCCCSAEYADSSSLPELSITPVGGAPRGSRRVHSTVGRESGAAMRILIADDDAFSRALLERTLQSLGYDVLALTNGADAWAALQRPDTPRLAVLDWMMPGLDGLEVCRRVRELQRAQEQAVAVFGATQYIYIVLLTAKAEKADIVAGLDSGADDYLTKPFDEGELKARLKTGRRIIALESALLSANEQLARQATYDPLTGVLNHGAIHQELRTEISRAMRESDEIGIILADLDHFKDVNDTYGHPAGDSVLRDAAHRMQKQVRAYDKIGRYGGEEFLFVIPRGGVKPTRDVAERIRESIASAAFQTTDLSISVTISLGVAAALGGTPIEPGALIKAADRALYRAKREGRNRVVCMALDQSSSDDDAPASDPPNPPYFRT